MTCKYIPLLLKELAKISDVIKMNVASRKETCFKRLDKPLFQFFVLLPVCLEGKS